MFEDGLAPVDFYLSSRSCILYVTEADLVAGNGYRKRLVRVRNVSTDSKTPKRKIDFHPPPSPSFGIIYTQSLALRSTLGGSFVAKWLTVSFFFLPFKV